MCTLNMFFPVIRVEVVGLVRDGNDERVIVDIVGLFIRAAGIVKDVDIE